MAYTRCTKCGKYTDLHLHTCWPLWLVREPDDSDDAAEVYAMDAEEAAKQYGEESDSGGGEYEIVGGTALTVDVSPGDDRAEQLALEESPPFGPLAPEGSLPFCRFVITGESVPSYSAAPNPAPTNKERAAAWNDAHPVGTLVRYWANYHREGPGTLAATDKPARAYDGPRKLVLSVVGYSRPVFHFEIEPEAPVPVPVEGPGFGVAELLPAPGLTVAGSLTPSAEQLEAAAQDEDQDDDEGGPWVSSLLGWHGNDDQDDEGGQDDQDDDDDDDDDDEGAPWVSSLLGLQRQRRPGRRGRRGRRGRPIRGIARRAARGVPSETDTDGSGGAS